MFIVCYFYFNFINYYVIKILVNLNNIINVDIIIN